MNQNGVGGNGVAADREQYPATDNHNGKQGCPRPASPNEAGRDAYAYRGYEWGDDVEWFAPGGCVVFHGGVISCRMRMPSNEIWMDFFRNILPELFGLIRLFASWSSEKSGGHGNSF